MKTGKGCFVVMACSIVSVGLALFSIWNPQIFYSTVPFHGIVTIKETGMPAANALLKFELHGERGPPIPTVQGVGRWEGDTGTIVVSANEDGEFESSFKDKRLTLVEIQYKGKTVEDYDALYVNDSATNSLFSKNWFWIDYPPPSPERREVHIEVYTKPRTEPLKKGVLNGSYRKRKAK